MRLTVDTSQVMEYIEQAQKDIDTLAEQIEVFCEKYPFVDIEVDIDTEALVDSLDFSIQACTHFDKPLFDCHCVVSVG